MSRAELLLEPDRSALNSREKFDYLPAGEDLPRIIGQDDLVLDTLNDPDRRATAAADLDGYAEHTLQPMGPGHAQSNRCGFKD